MKLFDVDWGRVLRGLPRFTALPVAARRLVLDELKPSGYVAAVRFPGEIGAITASGLARVDHDGSRVALVDEHRELVKVLRAMHRHPVFDAPTLPALVRYTEEHFSNDDIVRLGTHGPAGRIMHVTRQSLAQRVAFAGWVGDLLAASDDAALWQWVMTRGYAGARPALLERFRAVQAVAQLLVGHGEPIALQALMLQAGEPILDAPALASAVHAGLDSLVLFAGVRRVDLEPMIGLWPDALRALRREVPKPPTFVNVVEQFECALLMEDMTAVVADVVAAPLRLRANDRAVFARARAAIEARLVAVPRWAAPLLAPEMLSRVDQAAWELDRRGWVRTATYGGNPHLQVTAAGQGWLSMPGRDRLASLLEPIRRSTETNPRGAYDAPQKAGFFPFSLQYERAPKSLSLRDALTRAFLSAADGFVPVDDFLAYHSLDANPLLSLLDSRPAEAHLLFRFGALDSRQVFPEIWQEALSQFLVLRLLALGGAALGRTREGLLAFRVTTIGTYLLGASSDFTYADAGAAEIIVQPNFDVVFLGQAPGAEAALGRIAERVGVAPGLVFRLTRASILAAGEGGATAASVLATLGGLVSRPVPANVGREIAGWLAAVRRGTLRAVEVIECETPEAAERLVELIGQKCRQLAPTVFELPQQSAATRAALLKRLRAGGVFLSVAPPPEAERGRARGRRRSHRALDIDDPDWPT